MQRRYGSGSKRDCHLGFKQAAEHKRFLSGSSHDSRVLNRCTRNKLRLFCSPAEAGRRRGGRRPGACPPQRSQGGRRGAGFGAAGGRVRPGAEGRPGPDALRAVCEQGGAGRVPALHGGGARALRLDGGRGAERADVGAGGGTGGEEGVCLCRLQLMLRA